jgi:phosphatidylserine decarboxylase
MDARRILARGLEFAASPALYPLVERLADAPVPRLLRGPLYRSYAWVWGADLAEAEGPLERYPTLAAFFARRLRAGVRPIDPDPEVLVSPADGRLLAAGSFDAGDDPVVPVKGATIPLGRCLGDYRGALRAGGHYFVVYLSPRDYHRVHMPVDGRVVSWQAIPGVLLPVNGLGFRARPDVLAANERVVIDVEPAFGGRLVLVLVAAYGVARTRLTFADPDEVQARSAGPPVVLESPRPYRRGEELASFNLGSAVVAVWPAGRDPVLWLSRAGSVRMGRGLARRPRAGAG